MPGRLRRMSLEKEERGTGCKHEKASAVKAEGSMDCDSKLLWLFLSWKSERLC